MNDELPSHGILTSRIGRPVRYAAPKDVKDRGGPFKAGKIVDEVWATPERNTLPPHAQPCPEPHCWGTYSFCAQLIEWETGIRSIRLAYYRRRCGEDWWSYASQMTVDDEPWLMKELCEATLRKTSWFKDEG